MPHAVTATSDGKTYSYDCNGNLLSDGERTFTWDPDNKPVSITRAGVGATTFAYSGEGARVKKEGAGKAIRYVEDYEDHVTDGVQVRHIFLGPLRVATRVTGGINAGTYFTHGDHLGSLNVLTNSGGTEVQRLTYLPFGETHANQGSVDFHQHRYTDQEQDPETGLYFYQARYYNPVLGRFISPDSLVPDPGNPQSLNRYSYVINNPVNLIDPTGHSWEWEDFTGLVSSIWNQVFSFPTSPAMVPTYANTQTGVLVMESGTILDTTILPGTGPGTAWVLPVSRTCSSRKSPAALRCPMWGAFSGRTSRMQRLGYQSESVRTLPICSIGLPPILLRLLCLLWLAPTCCLCLLRQAHQPLWAQGRQRLSIVRWVLPSYRTSLLGPALFGTQ